MPKRKQQASAHQQDAKVSKIVASEQVANTDWNILSYRSHYEPEEHWELRRRFMESHQNWIPEDELVCLAQVFVNVELLHCRYPLETMERIKELSQGIADEYRNSRKNKLQRTFVSASDAAASKVQKKGPGEYRNAENPSTASSRKHKPVQIIRSLEDIYNNIVIMNNDYEQTKNEFDRLGKAKIGIVYSNDSKGKMIGSVQIGQFTVVQKAVDGGEKAAKKAIKLAFVETMAKHCYTIIRKKRPTQMTNTNVERKQVEGAVDHQGRTIKQDYKEQKIGESNLGFKLLQKLGWSGGSLGSKNEGIVDPINCQIKIGRQGLGSGPAEKKQGEEANKKGKINTRNESYGIDINFYRQMMQNFKDSYLEYDLVFSSEFTKEERALFHSMAQQLQLKTRSYGNDNDGTRQFVLLGRKLPPHELLERILENQDPIFCEMYEVQPPKNDDKKE
ncbi:AAEL008419-PA [Aedes aegypti]|nr:AAEL008419-PA [Aedes aegypti]